MTLARAITGLVVLAIIVVSIVPGRWRPHVLGNDPCEHLVAYFIAGRLLAIGYPSSAQRLSSAILLALCGGSLEFAQLWIPDRTASVADAAISTIGAWLGLLTAAIAARMRAAQRRSHGGPPGR